MGNLNFLLSDSLIILLLSKIRKHKTSEGPPQGTFMKPHLPKDLVVVGKFWKIVVVVVVPRLVSIVRRHTGKLSVLKVTKFPATHVTAVVCQSKRPHWKPRNKPHLRIHMPLLSSFCRGFLKPSLQSPTWYRRDPPVLHLTFQEQHCELPLIATILFSPLPPPRHIFSHQAPSSHIRYVCISHH